MQSKKEKLKCPKCESISVVDVGTYEFECMNCGHKWITLDVWGDKNESN